MKQLYVAFVNNGTGSSEDCDEFITLASDRYTRWRGSESLHAACTVRRVRVATLFVSSRRLT